MNDVLSFIERFAECDSVFANGCSYWFAVILHRRFIREGAKIMFDTETSRFGTMIGGKVYDIAGDASEKYRWVSWTEIRDQSLKDKVTQKYIM